MALRFYRFNDEVKHIKVIEKDSWIHITEAKKFESLLVSQLEKLPTHITHSAWLSVLGSFISACAFHSNRSWWSTISPIHSKKASSC